MELLVLKGLRQYAGGGANGANWYLYILCTGGDGVGEILDSVKWQHRAYLVRALSATHH